MIRLRITPELEVREAEVLRSVQARLNMSRADLGEAAVEYLIHTGRISLFANWVRDMKQEQEALLQGNAGGENDREVTDSTGNDSAVDSGGASSNGAGSEDDSNA